jgi:uncharacterized protein (TIRG00374 family)
MRRAYVWLSIAVGLALFGVFVATADWRGALELLGRANPEYLTLYAGATVLILFLHGVRWLVIAHSRGIQVSLVQAFGYRLARFAVSFVTPGPRVGGEAVGAGLVTRHSNGKRRVSYGEALSTMAIDRMVELQTFAFLFFTGVLLLAALGDISEAVKIPLFLFSSLLLLVIVMMVRGAMRGKIVLTKLLRYFVKRNSFLRELDRFEHTLITFYRSQPRDFFNAHAVAAVAWLVSLIEYYAIIRALGFEASLYIIFIVYSFIGFAYALPVPLALGTLETAQAAAFSLLGLPPIGGVLLAFITRIRDLSISAVGFIILLYHGILPRPPQKTIRT